MLLKKLIAWKLKLAYWDDFRTEKLIEAVKYPEVVLEQSRILLDI